MFDTSSKYANNNLLENHTNPLQKQTVEVDEEYKDGEETKTRKVKKEV
jgi:hypothetical protein